MNKNLDKIKQDIISRLDIRSEYESLGIQFVGNPNPKGWLACHNPYKNDDNPSCGVCIGPGPSRGYFVAFNMANGGKPWAVSFFDIVRDFGHVGNEFKDILNHYAEKTGIKISKTTSVPPAPEMVHKYVKSVPEKILEYLKRERGLSLNSIKKYKIGWSKRRGRIAFPVYDHDENLVNIRFYSRDKKPKMLNLTGYGQARLWGADRLSKAEAGLVICITEGEFDAMLCEQETGLISVSPTNGCNAFLPEWVGLFHGHHVVLVWDCDEEGRRAVKNLVLPSFKKAIKSGEVLSIKVIWLFPDNNDTE
jgi:hypothetical protein